MNASANLPSILAVFLKIPAYFKGKALIPQVDLRGNLNASSAMTARRRAALCSGFIRPLTDRHDSPSELYLHLETVNK
jgi:hypothetical protein